MNLLKTEYTDRLVGEETATDTHSAFLARPTERHRVVGVCGTRDLQQGLLLSSSTESGLFWLVFGDCGEVGTSCSCWGWWEDGAGGVGCCCC